MLQLPQQGIPVRAGQVHFVDKQEGGDLVLLQQLPQGYGVGLDAVGTADDQHRAIQNRQGSLRFGGKIHMARGIHQGDLPVFRFQHCLLGENGDALFPLQRMGVQAGVAVIHTAQGALCAAFIQQRLGKRSFSGVHMSQ